MEVEKCLVHAAITDNKVYHEVGLPYKYFTDVPAAAAWKALGELIESGVDRVDEFAIQEHTRGACDLATVSGWSLLYSVANVAYWKEQIRESYIKRKITDLAAKVHSWGEITSEEQIGRLHGELEKIELESVPELPTLAQLASAESERLGAGTSSKLQGLPSGIGIERVVPGGIPRGKVTTIFGESGNFKTTVKNNVVHGMATAGFRVLDVSLEDANELTAHRAIARATGVNYGRVSAGSLSPAEISKVRAFTADTASENIILAGDILPNIDEVIRIARSQQVDAVVIDYVQLLESRNPRLSQKEVLDTIMRRCQLAAKRDNMAYIVVSQVKQDVDARSDHTPKISDMIGSSAMRTASKLSLGVYRPGLYYKTPQKNSAYANLVANHPDGERIYPNVLEIHYLKNVLGEPRVVTHCLVNPGTGTIEPFDMRSFA